MKNNDWFPTGFSKTLSLVGQQKCPAPKLTLFVEPVLLLLGRLNSQTNKSNVLIEQQFLYFSGKYIQKGFTFSSFYVLR